MIHTFFLSPLHSNPAHNLHDGWHIIYTNNAPPSVSPIFLWPIFYANLPLLHALLSKHLRSSQSWGALLHEEMCQNFFWDIWFFHQCLWQLANLNHDHDIISIATHVHVFSNDFGCLRNVTKRFEEFLRSFVHAMTHYMLAHHSLFRCPVNVATCLYILYASGRGNCGQDWSVEVIIKMCIILFTFLPPS